MRQARWARAGGKRCTGLVAVALRWWRDVPRWAAAREGLTGGSEGSGGRRAGEGAVAGADQEELRGAYGYFSPSSREATTLAEFQTTHRRHQYRAVKHRQGRMRSRSVHRQADVDLRLPAGEDDGRGHSTGRKLDHRPGAGLVCVPRMSRFVAGIPQVGRRRGRIVCQCEESCNNIGVLLVLKRSLSTASERSYQKP